MAYCSYSDLIIRYPGIDDNFYSSESLVNSACIYYADAELNARLAVAYDVPFASPAPIVIEDLSMDLCYYRVLRTKDPERAEKIHDAVIGRIDAMVKGDEVIVTASGTTILPSKEGTEFWSSTQDYNPTFSMLDDDNAYSGIDPDLLDDEEDKRSA